MRIASLDKIEGKEVDLKYIDIDLFNNGETRESCIRKGGEWNE